jgi:hypothetical protein
MYELPILSDAELDAVCGGNGTTVNIGNGGNGGTAVNGVNKGAFNLVVVNKSFAQANGGNGGNFVIVPFFF